MFVLEFFNKPLISDGLKQFKMNPLRLSLSILGMVFGVASLIAMNAIGSGAQREITAIIESMGVDLVHITKNKVNKENLSEIVKFSAGLSLNDIYSLKDLYPKNQLVYRTSVPLAGLKTDKKIHTQAYKIFATGPRFLKVHDLKVKEGRRFLSQEHQDAVRVVILGYDLAKLVSQSSDFSSLIGCDLKLERAYFKVIGILPKFSDQGEGLLSRSSYNKSAIVPYKTMISELLPASPYSPLDLISLKVDKLEETLQAKIFLNEHFKKLHAKKADYKIIAPEEILRQRTKAQGLLNLVFAIIATISLIVGGIGIMNIMIASVTERTKEIGLRRALGATQKDILSMFLNESLFISFVGGGLGIILGILLSELIAVFAGLSIAYSLLAVFLSVSCFNCNWFNFWYLSCKKSSSS